MAIRQSLYSLDAYFNSTIGDKIILNNLSYWEKEDKALVEKTMQSVYDKDTITMVPKCACGKTEGMFAKGKTCDYCGSKVMSVFGEKDPLLWFRSIEGAGKFISPQFYTMISRTISTKIDILRWIGDSNYNPPLGGTEVIVQGLMQIQGFSRSYLWLTKNLEKVLITLSNMPKFKSKTTSKDQTFRELILMFRKDKKAIFSDYLPLLNRRMFVMENTSMGRYTNIGIADAFDAVLYFIKHCTDTSQIKKERTMARTTAKMAELYEEHVKTYLSAKEGILRKHMYGTRSHFTARAVIASIAGPHKYDQVQLPWGIGVTLFRPHLLNLLSKMGFKYKEINSKLFRAVQHFDQDVSDCLDELISSSKYEKGIAIGIQRN